MEAEEPGFLGALVTELHCAAFHQIEGMLLLLLAEYQDRPDWVYLTSYGNSDMKKAAKLIAAGDYGGITNQIHKSASEFIIAAVYAGWRPDDRKTNVDWQASLNDIEWLIRHCAE